MTSHQSAIEQGLEQLKTAKDQANILAELTPAITETIAALDRGEIRVCDYVESSQSWRVNTWVKEAILLYFRIRPMETFKVDPFTYHDKIPLKQNYEELKVRVVPPATARFGSFMEPGVVLMPSYVNIGAYVGAGSMVDTWATVGTCAQIGAGVHLAGGVGIGGVLEPAGAVPVVIEDGAFLGSRAIVVEGVRVRKRAVLAANVTITKSTPIIDIRDGKTTETKGEVPEGAVVVPGTKEKTIEGGGKIYTACAYIIGERKASTDLKTSLNDVLREFALSV